MPDAFLQLQRGIAVQGNRAEQEHRDDHRHVRHGKPQQQHEPQQAAPYDEIEPGKDRSHFYRGFHKPSLSMFFNCIDSSWSCISSMVLGASSMTSRPLLFLGNAIKSRILSLPPRIAHNRSNPKAIPPCGGAPYSKAPSRNPNLCKASSGLMPSAANIFSCNSRWKIRIDPPPISFPFNTIS